MTSDYIYHFSAPRRNFFSSYTATTSVASNVPGSSRPLPPPSYDEAIREAEAPSRSTLSAAAAVSSLDQVVVDQPERQPLLYDARKSTSTKEDLPIAPKGRNRESFSDVTGENGESTSSEQPPPQYSLSDATFERTQQGVTSCDEKLNREPEALFKFFQEHNDKPEVAVCIRGYHTEDRTESHTYVGEDGKTHSGTTYRTEEVTDFLLNLDLSEFVSDYGEITIVPEKNKPQKEIMQLMEEYVKNENKLKEIEMQKVVNWEYEGISRAITAAIRRHGYTNYLTISYPIRNRTVTVHSNSKLARFSRHPLVQILCILSCLWIIFLPLSWFYKKSYKNKFRSEFRMTISPHEWFNRNVQTIVGTVRWL